MNSTTSTDSKQILIRQSFLPSIGFRHFDEGDEMLTLQNVWSLLPTSRRVTLPGGRIHSKGSFNPSIGQDNLREYLTVGDLLEECCNMPSSCNVCSMRMSPIPHPHTPGNTWASRCTCANTMPKENGVGLFNALLGMLGALRGAGLPPSTGSIPIPKCDPATWTATARTNRALLHRGIHCTWRRS